MARKGPQIPLPGNDGRWFLELAGVDESPPGLAEAYAEMEALAGPKTSAVIWSRLVTGLLLMAGVAVLAIGITIRVADLHIDTVLSNSMQPTLSAGDVAVTQVVPTDSIRAGDVIAFVAPGSDRILLHRVASLEDGVITTRGDANSVDDPWRITLTDPTAHRLVAVVPYVGWLTELQRPAFLLAGGLVALIILLELRKGVGKRRANTRTQHQ